MSQTMLVQGNHACALGALAAGVRFFAGYPITPSTEIAEVLAKELPKVGGKFIQMEDEIASIGAICGASLGGVKAITATSGPGFSLMQELIGYAALAEIPIVIVNVQRGGPSTGQPTSPSQSDVMQARWGSHGDRGVIALVPSSVQESYQLMIDAVNLAERFRTPVIFLMDEVVGHMREKLVIPKTPPTIINRRKPKPGELPYAPGPDGVPAPPPFGEGYHFHVTGLIHDETGFPTGSPEVTDKTIRRLHQKLENNMDEILRYDELYNTDAEYLIISYGCSARSAEEAVRMAREKGIKAGLLRLISIWPFPSDLIEEKCARVKKVFVAEMNYGQVTGEVTKVLGRSKVQSILRVDTQMITPRQILEAITREGN